MPIQVEGSWLQEGNWYCYKFENNTLKHLEASNSEGLGEVAWHANEQVFVKKIKEWNMA